MEIWMIIIVWILCAAIGILLGTKLQKASDQDMMAKWCEDRFKGVLMVDKIHPEVNGGLYTQLKVDPQTYDDNEVILLKVMYITNEDSQQNQGT